MADDVEREGVRLTVRPLFLYPFLGLMAFGLISAVAAAALARDWQSLGVLAGLVSLGWFYYRNPVLLNGPVWGQIDDFRAARDVEFLWLALALGFASAVVF